MKKPFEVPSEEIRREITIKNSRFIATLTFVFSVEEAREFIQRIINEFPDATHNVPAFLIGFENNITAYCTDDGEPSGTAGKPALLVLSKSGLGNVAVVVTRYFGGVKLGTGGLVKAYTDAVRQVVNNVPRAIQIKGSIFQFNIAYNIYDKLIFEFDRMNVQILSKNFGEEISLTAFVRQEVVEMFIKTISDLSGGKVLPRFVKEDLVYQRKI